MARNLEIKIIRKGLHQLFLVDKPRPVLIQVKKGLLHVRMLLKIILFHHCFYRFGYIILVLIEIII